MENFRVIWEIDIAADSPVKAAQEAYDIMQDSASLATFFTVVGEDGEGQSIDLNNLEEEGDN